MNAVVISPGLRPAEARRRRLRAPVTVVGEIHLDHDVLGSVGADLFSAFGHRQAAPPPVGLLDGQRMEFEEPNLHEFDLDRAIAFGHTWSPTPPLDALFATMVRQAMAS